MLAFFTTLLLLSLNSVYSFDDQKDVSPFYSTPVEEVDLSLVQIKSDDTLKYPELKKENNRNFTLSLNKAQNDYYSKLSELDKKVFIKIASLEIFREIKNKNYLSKRYTLLYKKNSAFNIETVAVIPLTYERALPVITDYASYNDWAMKDINILRDGEKGKYFFDITSLRYFAKKEQKFLELNVSMLKLAKGNFSLELLIQDSTTVKPVPFFSLKLNAPSELAKNVEGTFRFIILPDVPYFVTYFTGKAEVGWVYYRFLPLNVIRSQFVARIDTMLENIQYKAESVKYDSAKTNKKRG